MNIAELRAGVWIEGQNGFAYRINASRYRR
jgi:hypothetical protein